MSFLTHTLGPHWLALAFAAAAVRAIGRRRRALAFALGLPALGGLALVHTRFGAFDLPLWLLIVSATVLVVALARLLWSGAWSFAVGVALVALLLVSLGALVIP